MFKNNVKKIHILQSEKKVITVVKTCHITRCLSVCILTQSVVNSHLSPSPASLSMLREDVAQKCPHRPPSGEICPEKLANEFCAHFRDQQQCREHRWAVHVHRKRSGHLCTWWHHDARTSCKQTLVTTWIYLMDGTSQAQNHSLDWASFSSPVDCFEWFSFTDTLGLYSTDSVFCFDALCTDVFFSVSNRI